MNCKNCDHKVEGNFCANCGQSAKVDRINFRNLLSELSNSISQLDKGFLFTLKELFVRPGQCVKDYLDGKRKNYIKPIAYAFTLSTIYFLLTKYLQNETFVSDFLKGFASAADDPEAEAQHLAILNWFAHNYAYTILLLLPLYSFASYLAFFGSGVNFLEHVVLNAYITGQQTFFYSIYSILNFAANKDDLFASIALFSSLAYSFYVFWQFFSKQNRVSVVFRWILTYAIIVIMITVFLIGIFFITTKLA